MPRCPAGPGDAGLADRSERARDPEVDAGSRRSQGAHRVPGESRVHGGVLRRRHLRTGAERILPASPSSRSRSMPGCSTSSRTARLRAPRTSTTPPMPTSRPTSSCRRWSSASWSMASRSTMRWTKRRSRASSSTTSTSKPTPNNGNDRAPDQQWEPGRISREFDHVHRSTP